MKLKDIQAKLKKGEELTDAEKQFLADYDESKAVNDAAAAARRKAEEKQAELEKEREKLNQQMADIQAKLDEKENAGKSDAEKAQAQIEALSKQVGELKTQAEEASSAQAQMSRNQRIADIRRTAGIQFVPGLDHAMLEQSFSRAFEGIEDLESDEVIKTKVETWQAMNKAAILDTSGSGTGSEPNGAGGTSADVEALEVSGAALIEAATHGNIDEAEKMLEAAEKADGADKLTIT